MEIGIVGLPNVGKSTIFNARDRLQAGDSHYSLARLTMATPTLSAFFTAPGFLDGAAYGRFLAEHIEGARFVELDGVDHFFHAGDIETLLAPVQEFLTGKRDIPEDDRVLATVLFTDIVDATGRAEAMGDRAWKDLLERHHEVVRHELARFRGHEVDTAGDGFFASFEGPALALM